MLLDYGGTLVEEVAYDVRAGMDLLLSHVASPHSAIPIEPLIARIDRVTREVANRRDEFNVETPWPALTRLIYEPFGICFTRSLADLELAFWNASVTTRPMPGALDTLLALRKLNIPLGVVSNSSFRAEVIRHELAKHGMADVISLFVVSAEYAVRKPNPLLFETAAARLGVPSSDVWFVGDRLDTDVAGARAAGMVAVSYAPDQARIEEGGADLVVATWRDLLEAVRAADRFREG